MTESDEFIKSNLIEVTVDENGKRASDFSSLPSDDYIPEPKKYVNCLCCDKQLTFTEEELVMGGGFMKVSFHYGSRNDQCDGRLDYNKAETYKQEMLACDKIQAFICDDCFEEKLTKFQGFMIEKTIKEMRVL